MFMQVIVPLTLSGVPTTANGPALMCAPNAGLGPEVPPILRTPANLNCEPLNDRLQVRWAVVNNQLSVELIGRVSETEWMGFGRSGMDSRTFMIGADPVVVDTFTGQFRARDFYLSNRSQCSNGNGVCPDTSQSTGVDDVSSVSGERDSALGVTVVRYKKPITPSDVGETVAGAAVDLPISIAPGAMTFVVWAIGPVSDIGLPLFHSVFPSQDYLIEFGRKVVNNCQPLAVAAAPTASPIPFDVPMLKGVTDITARIGPSGGSRVSFTVQLR